MASREHSTSNVRIKVSTISTNIVGSFIEWGGEAWRERRRRVAFEWWNPWTWGRYEWRREGTPPLTSVEFFRGDGQPLSDVVLNPSITADPGYFKKSVVYMFVSYGTGRGLDNLGNDARSVARVTVTYSWDGQTRTLSAP